MRSVMSSNKILFTLLFMFGVGGPLFYFSGCTKCETYNTRTGGKNCDVIYGCMDEEAINYDPEATHSDKSCIYKEGIVMFWTDTVNEAGPITVEVPYPNDPNNRYQEIGQIDQYYDQAPSSCIDSNKAVTYREERGTYEFRAYDTSGYEWEGTFEIEESQCTPKLLEARRNGKVVFWTDSLSILGYVDVYVDLYYNTDSKDGKITNKHQTAPSCEGTNALVFDLRPGSYEYSAAPPGSVNPDMGTVRIGPDSCSQVYVEI